MVMRGADFKANYKVASLLETIKKNREKHKTTYDKAIVNYQRELIATLESMLSAAKAGKKVQHHINLSTPVEYTKDYDMVIKMLESTCDEELTLDSEQFKQLVLDDWGWSNTFEASTTSYANKRYR